jgi:hypothetical protein
MFDGVWKEYRKKLQLYALNKQGSTFDSVHIKVIAFIDQADS